MVWIKVAIFLTWLTIACCYPSPLDDVNNKFVSIRSGANSSKQDFQSVSDFGDFQLVSLFSVILLIIY